MEPFVVASIILSAAIVLASMIVARSLRRERGETVHPHVAADLSLKAIGDALARIERQLALRESSAAQPTSVTSDHGSGEFAAEADGETTTRAPRLRPVDEIRRLAARGRDAVEIAQLVDADVGEVELVLRLDRASRATARNS